MATTIEYALMAGASYRDTRADINRFPIPSGWNLGSRNPQDNATGFEAAAFGNGTTLATSTEIVISFAGTNPNSLIDPDNAANVKLATGYGHAQLLQAAEYYLAIQRQNPGATITLTGHSLGGGLAALVGVFFHVSATTFDQAPFANSAQSNSLLSNPLNILTPDVAAELKISLLTDGYTEAELAPLTNFLLIRPADGSIPNSNLINTIRVDGEFTSSLGVGIYDPIGNPATIITHGPHFSPSIDLHDQALLTDFLLSDAAATTDAAGQKQNLSEVTKKLTDLLGMFFDKQLFAHDTDPNTTKEDFLNRLVKHQAGVQGSITADAMVTRFTADLWKLAQSGGLTLNESNGTYSNWNNISKALTAFAMQKYYSETDQSTGYKKELFTDLGAGNNGIRFDMVDVSNTPGIPAASSVKLDLSQFKGYEQYFKNYITTTGGFSNLEKQLITSLLPYMRDWYVQAGNGGMTATDTFNRGAFMLGGTGADTLTGGAGNDAYVYTTGDGFDTILDSDGLGSIAADHPQGVRRGCKWLKPQQHTQGNILTGGEQFGDARVHRDSSVTRNAANDATQSVWGIAA